MTSQASTLNPQKTMLRILTTCLILAAVWQPILGQCCNKSHTIPPTQAQCACQAFREEPCPNSQYSYRSYTVCVDNDKTGYDDCRTEHIYLGASFPCLGDVNMTKLYLCSAIGGTCAAACYYVESPVGLAFCVASCVIGEVMACTPCDLITCSGANTGLPHYVDQGTPTGLKCYKSPLLKNTTICLSGGPSAFRKL